MAKNAVLTAMPDTARDSLGLRQVDFKVNDTLYEPNEPIEYAYFPEIGVLSIVALMANGDSIEVGTIGHEGMIGSFLLLNTRAMPYRSFVQVEGFGHRCEAARLIKAASDSAVAGPILRSEAAVRVQSMQNIACNGLHSIEQRCCKWLLMTQDRVDSPELKLTHEFLGLMLGVRRASVSDVLGPLRDAGLVDASRGVITVRDREGLLARACECYRVIATAELQNS